MAMTSVLRLPLGVGLLCGCATTAPVASSARPPEPACSFRAATSCWTMNTRFPPKRAERADSQPEKPFDPRPSVVATAADSAGSAP